MANKWEIGWYPDPFWDDSGESIVGKIGLTDEYYLQPPNYSETQVEFFVKNDLSIVIDEIHEDDNGEWKGIPKYIESQIKREAKQIFKARNNEEFKTLMRAGEIKIKYLLAD